MVKAKPKKTAGQNDRRDSKPKRVGMRQYDWNVEKLLFFESDFIEVKPWWVSTGRKHTTAVSKGTHGWTKEKMAWRKDQTEKFLADFVAKKQERLARLLDKVGALTEKQVENALASGIIDTDDLKRLWEIVRTENQLPTRIIHAKNENLNYDAAKIRAGILDKIKDKLSKHDRPKGATPGS